MSERVEFAAGSRTLGTFPFRWGVPERDERGNLDGWIRANAMREAHIKRTMATLPGPAGCMSGARALELMRARREPSSGPV